MGRISKIAIVKGMHARNRAKRRYVELLSFLSLGGLLLTVLVVVNFLGIMKTYAENVPTEESIRRELENKGENSNIYDRNGELLYTFKDPDRDRVYVQVEQIPPTVVAAILAAEDRDFFLHSGIDYIGSLKGLFTTLVSGGENTVGGSTLTQQLVKQNLLDNQRTFDRKIQEAIIAMLVERDYDKNEILEYYLNSANFGGRVQGIGTASRVYFNKNVSDLTIAEAAYLSGLVQSPGEYSPLFAQDSVKAMTLSLARRNQILEQLKTNTNLLAYLNTNNVDYLRQFSGTFVDPAAGQTEPKYTVEIISSLESEQYSFSSQVDLLRAPHWVFYIRDILQSSPYNLSLSDLYSGGYRIYTSLDLRIQQTLEAQIAEGVRRYGNTYKFANAASVMIDSNSGEILAMVGSKGYNLPENPADGRFDPKVNVTISPQTLGSSLKPWVAYQAFASGKYNSESTVIDSPKTFAGGYKPKNFDGKFRGSMTIRKALLDSRNLPFLKLQDEMGAWNMGLLMKQVGYNPNRNYGLAAVIGGVDETLLDHTAAYTGMANGGRVMAQKPVLKIEKTNGEVVFSAETRSIFTLNNAAVREVTNIMGDKSYREAYNNLKFIGGQKLAGKTGTSDGNKDTYYIGFGPKFVIGVWCGNNDNTRMTSAALGSSTALPIWNLATREILAKFPEYGQNGSY